MSYKIQIEELNRYVKTKLAPSPVHGIGVFAMRDIPKGQKLYIDMQPKLYNLPYSEFRNLFPEVRDDILSRWPNVLNGSYFGYPDTRITAYMNHSETPNYDAINDEVLEDIAAGEEIFEDYRKIARADEVFPFLKE